MLLIGLLKEDTEVPQRLSGKCIQYNVTMQQTVPNIYYRGGAMPAPLGI